MPLTFQSSPDPHSAPEPPEELRVRPRRWSRKSVLFLAGLSTLAITGLIALLLVQPAPRQQLRLPDGTVLSLEAVTYDTERKTSGTPWQRLLRALAPAPWKDATGAREFQGTMPGALLFWATRNVEPPILFSGQVSPEMVIVPVDEAGNAGPVATQQATVSLTETYACYQFPRRGRTVRLQFYVRDGQLGEEAKWRLLGEFTTPNPDPGPHLLWTPPALPVRGSAKGVELEVTDFTAGPRPDYASLSPRPGEEYWRARYRLREKGKPTTAWSAEFRIVQDATGTSSTIFSSVSSPQGAGAHELFFLGPKLPSEQVVQALVHLWPTATGRIAPEDRWTVRDIPLPAPGQQRSLRRRGKVQGISLELGTIYGARARMLGNLGFVTPNGTPRLTLKLPATMPEGTRGLMVSVTDDQGRPVTLERNASRNDGRESLELYSVKAQPGARRIHLVYAIVRHRELVLRLPVKHQPQSEEMKR